MPHFAADIALLEQLTGRTLDHWRDARNPMHRRPLDVDRRFGTAASSIDSPLSRHDRSAS